MLQSFRMRFCRLARGGAGDGRRARFRLGAGAAAIALAVFGIVAERAAAQEDPLVEDGGPAVRHVVVTVNKSRTLKFERPFANTQIGSPDIADLLPLTDTTLYVLGKKPGTTNISVFDPNKQLVAVIDLEITPDTGLMRSKIQSSTGSRGITVTSA